MYYFPPSDCELPEDRICGSLILMFQCLAQCRQLLNVWISEWVNKWMNHWRRALPVIVLNGSLSRVYSPGGRDCSLYSMCRTELCLLFRLIGGKSSKSQEHLAPLSLSKQSRRCKRINLEGLRDTSPYCQSSHPPASICKVLLFSASH